MQRSSSLFRLQWLASFFENFYKECDLLSKAIYKMKDLSNCHQLQSYIAEFLLTKSETRCYHLHLSPRSTVDYVTLFMQKLST